MMIAIIPLALVALQSIGAQTTIPENSNGCPSVGIAYLPYPPDCHRFLKCVDGELTEAPYCRQGMNFDANKRTCNWEIYAQCEVDAAPPVNADGSPLLHANGCPTVDLPDFPVFLMYPYDLNTYVKCINGKLVQEQCAPELYFNPVLQMCDIAMYAGCVVPTLPPVTPEPHTCPTNGPCDTVTCDPCTFPTTKCTTPDCACDTCPTDDPCPTCEYCPVRDCTIGTCPTWTTPEATSPTPGRRPYPPPPPPPPGRCPPCPCMC